MSKALVPVEQKEVEFYGDQLTAVRAKDGQVYVSIRHMCEALGIDDNAQQQRIRRHTVLGEGRRACKLHALGKRSIQTTYVLRVDLVPLWIAGIRTSTVNEDIRPKLEQFQREAAVVLWEAFQEGRLTTDTAFEELLATADDDAVQAYQMALAVVKLARSHIQLQQQVLQHAERLDSLEAQLGNPGRMVTPEQASQISQAVKTVALAVGKKTGRNEFGAVYGELYRRFEITSYKSLPVHKFEDALAFLTEWHQSVTTDVPF